MPSFILSHPVASRAKICCRKNCHDLSRKRQLHALFISRHMMTKEIRLWLVSSVALQKSIFWVAAPCSILAVCQRFAATYCLHSGLKWESWGSGHFIYSVRGKFVSASYKTQLGVCLLWCMICWAQKGLNVEDDYLFSLRAVSQKLTDISGDGGSRHLKNIGRNIPEDRHLLAAMRIWNLTGLNVITRPKYARWQNVLLCTCCYH
jgi:hypothetical protein